MRHIRHHHYLSLLILCTCFIPLSKALAKGFDLKDTKNFTQKLNVILQEKTEEKNYHMSVELITSPKQMKQIEEKRDRADGPSCLFVNKDKVWDAISLQLAYQGIRPADISPRVHLSKEWHKALNFDHIAICEWATVFETSNTGIQYWYVLTVGKAPGKGVATDKLMWVFKTQW